LKVSVGVGMLLLVEIDTKAHTPISSPKPKTGGKTRNQRARQSKGILTGFSLFRLASVATGFIADIKP